MVKINGKNHISSSAGGAIGGGNPMLRHFRPYDLERPKHVTEAARRALEQERPMALERIGMTREQVQAALLGPCRDLWQFKQNIIETRRHKPAQTKRKPSTAPSGKRRSAAREAQLAAQAQREVEAERLCQEHGFGPLPTLYWPAASSAKFQSRLRPDHVARILITIAKRPSQTAVTDDLLNACDGGADKVTGYLRSMSAAGLTATERVTMGGKVGVGHNAYRLGDHPSVAGLKAVKATA